MLAGVSFGVFDPQANPFIEAVRLVSASIVDSSLSDVPLGRWLASIVGPAPPGLRGAPRISWLVEYCNSDEASWYPGDLPSSQTYWPAGTAARRKSRALCAIALSEQPEDRMLLVLIEIATVVEDTGVWTPIVPSFHSAHVRGKANVLDVATLASARDLLQLPEDLWPKVDLTALQADVSIRPERPKPGDLVTIRIAFTNVGFADARYAHGSLAICPGRGCTWPGIFQDVFGRVRVGAKLSVERSIVLPDGMADVALCMEIWPSSFPRAAGYVQPRTVGGLFTGATR